MPAPCSGVSIPPVPEEEVRGSISGRFLTNGSFLPLALHTAAGSPFTTGSLTGTPEHPALYCSISLRDLFGGESLFFLRSFRPFVLFFLQSIIGSTSNGDIEVTTRSAP
jgi:hypothetical protein